MAGRAASKEAARRSTVRGLAERFEWVHRAQSRETFVPSYKPTKCARCGTVIVLGEDAYSVKPGKTGREYWCEECFHEDMEKSSRRTNRHDGQ